MRFLAWKRGIAVSFPKSALSMSLFDGRLIFMHFHRPVILEMLPAVEALLGMEKMWEQTVSTSERVQ